MGKRAVGWGMWAVSGCLWAGAHAQAVPSAAAPSEPIAAAGDVAPEAADQPHDTADVDPLSAQRESLLARWRRQVDRHSPRLVSDASSFSLGEREPAPVDGPLRFRTAGPAPLPKADAWSLKSASDYADLRQMLRSRTLQWQPMSLGRWKFGAAVGPVRSLGSQLVPAEKTELAVMPMASYQMRRHEWRVGVVPATNDTPSTLVVRLRVRAF
ncbi:MAG: hypothetical protein V4739_16250 [Pseudomonadota bacterium]